MDTSRLKVQEAQLLANLWQWFLLDDDKYTWVERFNHQPAQFDFNALLHQLDGVLQQHAEQQQQQQQQQQQSPQWWRQCIDREEGENMNMPSLSHTHIKWRRCVGRC